MTLIGEDELERSVFTLKAEITKVIKSVEHLEYQTLLEKRYLCFQSWEQIAVDMDYDLRWIYRLHKKALDVVTEVREKHAMKDH